MRPLHQVESQVHDWSRPGPNFLVCNRCHAEADLSTYVGQWAYYWSQCREWGSARAGLDRNHWDPGAIHWDAGL